MRRPRLAPCVVCVLVFASAFSPRPARAATAPAQTRARLTDQITCANRADEKAHQVAFDGEVFVETAGDQVGGHDMRRRVRTVRGNGSWLSYRVRVDPQAATTLEVEEINGRQEDVRGYLVLVNDKKIYLRTWQGAGAGPVHFFVQIPPTGKNVMRVTLRNQSGTPFSISRLWAFSDFTRFFDHNQLAVPYTLAPTVRLTSDFDADRALLEKIRAALGGGQTVARPAFTAFVPYAALDARAVEERVDYLLRLAEAAEMPVQMGFDTWWGSTPGGSDGKNGFWTDVKYQQVVYNATRRAYQLSIPNRWSNTPWLSVNHPDLLAFKTRRLTESLAYLARRDAERRAAGKRSLILAVNLDNEPVYWASGNAGLGSDLLLADFNPKTVAAARQAGVRLAPEDGLSAQERFWLARNLLGYNEAIARAAKRGLGRGATIAVGGKTFAPGDPLSGNVFTQAMVSDADIQYPMLSRAYPFWETAAPRSARVGGEWNGDSVGEREAVLHQIALGRNAAVNSESSNDAAKMRGVRPGYALAQRYFTLYNYPLDRLNVAVSQIRDLSQAFPTFVYQPILRETRFTKEDWKRHVIAQRNVRTGQIGNTAAVALYPISASQPGYITYQLRAPHRVFQGGPFLDLTGRAFVFQKKEARVFVRVLAGAAADPGKMREVARWFDTGGFGPPDRVDLSRVARGKQTVYVRIEMHAPGIAPDVLSWCSVRHVRFTTPWPADLTRGLAPQDESLETVRRQNLLVSWRRDAEIAMGDLAWQRRTAALKPLAQARAAYARGAYAEAYRRACQGAGVLLPAVYQVQTGSGRLAPYPVRVDTPGPVAVTLHELGDQQIRLTLRAQRLTRVTIHLLGLPRAAAYEIQKTGGMVTLQRRRRPRTRSSHGRLGLTTDPKGMLALSLTAAAYPARPIPRRLNGIYRGPSGRGGFLVVPRTGANSVFVPVGPGTVLRRGESGKEISVPSLGTFANGDQIMAVLDARGTATEVTATYEILDGVVLRFGELTPFALPSLTLTNAPGKRHIIALTAPLHTPASDSPVQARPLGTVDIAPGDRVRLRINPSVGRVFEVWKTNNTP